MATQIWVNIGSGSGLLPDVINPLPNIFCGIYMKAIILELLMNVIRNIGPMG